MQMVTSLSTMRTWLSCTEHAPGMLSSSGTETMPSALAAQPYQGEMVLTSDTTPPSRQRLAMQGHWLTYGRPSEE